MSNVQQETTALCSTLCITHAYVEIDKPLKSWQNTFLPFETLACKMYFIKKLTHDVSFSPITRLHTSCKQLALDCINLSLSLDLGAPLSKHRTHH